MRIYYDVAFRSSRYEAKVGLGENLPGEQLARDIASGLEHLGQPVLGVFRDEPFWTIRVSGAPKDVDVLVGLWLPAEEAAEAIWSVSVPSSLGALGRLFGKAESESVVALLRDIDAVLQRDNRWFDLRWFEELPVEPYEVESYSESPMAIG